MTIDFTKGDDLSDLLGGEAPAPRALPEGEAFARIRALADKPPVAKAFTITCQACGGSGVWRGTWKSGPCFKCKGVGSFQRKTSPAKLAQAKEARMDRKDQIRQEYAPRIAFVKAKLDKGGLPERFADMLADFLGRMANGQHLSPGQEAVIDRAMERDAQFAQNRAAKAQDWAAKNAERVKAVDVANLVDCFQRAQEAGLKSFTLRFDGIHLQSDKSTWSKIWVSSKGYGSARLGVIENGVYRPGRDATDEIIAKLALISADPFAAAKAYVQITNNCSVCGRFLKNQDSVDAGMGPICAGRINRPGLKYVEVKAGVDF